jgi:hypothetical protein
MARDVPVFASDGKALVVAMDHARTFGAGADGDLGHLHGL